MTGPIFNAGAIEATAQIDRSQFTRDLRQMQADIIEFQRNGIDLNISIDKAKVKADLQALTKELSTGNDAIKLTLGLDTTKARADLDAFKAYMKGVSDAKINITGDTTPLKQKATEAVGITRSIPDRTIKLDASSDPFDIKIAQAIVKLEELQAKKASPEIDLKIATLEAQVDQAKAKLAELQRMNVTPKATVDMVALFADLAKARADLNELNDRKVSPEIDLKIAQQEAQLQQFRVHLDELNAQKVNPEIDLLVTKSQEALDRFQRQIDILSSEKSTPEVDASIDKFQTKIAGVQDTITRLNTLRVTPKLDADIAALEAKMAIAEERVRSLDAMKANPKLDAQIDVAQSKIEQIVERIHILDAQTSNSKLDADISAALAKIDTLQQRISEFGRQKDSAKLDVDIAAAEANITALEARRDAFNAKQANIKVDANTTTAIAKLDEVENKRRALDGKSALVDVRMGRDSGTSNLIIAGVAAGLAALVDVAPAAAAGMAGVSAAVAVGAQGFGALKLGLNGIVTAYQAMATQAQTSATQQGTAHTGVESALRSLDTTRQAAARSAENAAQSITDAERNADHTQISGMESVQNASETYARTLISNAQSVQNAKDSEARTIISGDRAVSDAEQALKNAQVNATDAQKNLTDARAAEVFALEDLQLKLKGSAISEEEAAQGLQQAVEHLRVLKRDPLATPLQLEQAQTAIERAQQTVDESKQSYKETSAEAAKAAQTGVDGSASVVAAQKQVTQANQAVVDSFKNLQRAQDDAAYAQKQAAQSTANAIDNANYSNEQSAKASAKAITDAAYANQTAQESVTKAIESQKDQQEQSANSIADALARISDAQETAANLSVKANNRVQYAMSLLSPEGQKFVTFLYDDMRPAINSISDSVAGNMLPKFQDSLHRLLDLVPELKTGLGETGTVFGNLAEEGTKMATSPAFKAEFATILHGNNLMMGDMGRSGLLVVDAFTGMYTASLPLLENFTLFVNKGAIMFDQWVQGKVTSGQFAQFMQLAGEKAKELWDFLVQLVTTVTHLGIALAPVGETLLTIVDAGLKFIDWVSRINPALILFIGYSTALFFAISQLGKGIQGIATVLSTSESRFSKIGQAIDDAALSAGTYTEKIVGTVASSETAALAGEKVATAGSKVSSAISKVGTALPIVGAALIGLTAIWDSTITSLNDGATAMLKGGSAAEQMTTKVDDQLTGFGKWLNSMLHFVPTSQDMRVEMQKQLDAMDPLQRAQTLATQAQNDYSDAVSKFGVNSPAAIAASNLWKDATQRAADVQDNLRSNLVSATDALIAQRDEMLGNLNAEIRFKDDLATLTKGVADHGKSVDLDTDAGRRNVEQLNNMSQAAIDNLTQMVKNGDSTQTVTDKTNDYKTSLYNAAIQIGYTKDQAQHYVDQLHLVPSQEATNIQLNGIDSAAQELQHYIDNLNVVKNMGPLQTVLDLRQQVLQDIVMFPPPRARGGIDFIGMAAGDIRPKAMSANLANIVTPNTPTLIGDNKQFNEAYIPLDPTSSRSQAIFDLTAKALGRTTDASSPNNTSSSSFKSSLADQRAYNQIFAAPSTNTNGNNSSNDNTGSGSVPNNSSSTSSVASQTTQDGSTTIGTLVMQVPYGASPQEYVEHLDFNLQYHRKKGVYRR